MSDCTHSKNKNNRKDATCTSRQVKNRDADLFVLADDCECNEKHVRKRFRYNRRIFHIEDYWCTIDIFNKRKSYPTLKTIILSNT